MVTKEMIGAAHDICLKKGDFVLSASLLERIYLAMRDKADERDSAGWDAYEDLRKASDEMVLNLRQRVQELEFALAETEALEMSHGERIEKLTAERDELLAALVKLSGMKLNMIADGIVDKAIASVKSHGQPENSQKTKPRRNRND